MKNKEIEELLKDIKKQIIIDERLGKEIAKDFHKTTLNYNEAKELLSYIEQLEKRNKELYEGFMATQEELTDYAIKNEQLENNRDKAYEFVKEKRKVFEWYDTDLFYLESLLKGGSDE